jgi:2-amino-4-hydroxy-6-hydroxymethyldihydropteridine diphosphokinase
MAVVFLALGSNLGNRRQYMDRAVTLLQEHVTIDGRAPYYVTSPVGYTDQGDFMNGLVRGTTKLSPQELIEFIRKVEEEVGRVRRWRWGPREVDVDIIFYDDMVVDEPDLMIPHVRYSERDFVLQPLIDIAPDHKDPVTGLTAGELLADLSDEQRSVINKEA